MADNKKIVMVPVTWSMCGYMPVEVDVDATVEDAVMKVDENPDDYDLSNVIDSEYVDSSFGITGDIDECACVAYVKGER